MGSNPTAPTKLNIFGLHLNSIDTGRKEWYICDCVGIETYTVVREKSKFKRIVHWNG